MPDPGGGSGPPSISALAATFDLDPTGAEVVRSASRDVVRFPRSRARTSAQRDGRAAVHEASVATLLAQRDVPAARVRSGPVDIDGWTITLWDEIDVQPDAEADPSVLGRVAGHLHRATADLSRVSVGASDPIGAARQQMQVAVVAGTTVDDELRLLESETARLEPVWSSAAAGDNALIHGDLHHGNVVLGPDGPVLVDLELAGWGPRAYDAAPTVAFVRWYGRPRSDLADFDEAYGAPLTEECTGLKLDQIWRLWSASWAVANRHRSKEAEDEAQVRLATLRTGHGPRPWVLH